MKDSFLYTLRRQPPRDLTQKVWRDIAALPGDRVIHDRVMNDQSAAPQAPPRTSRRRVLALAALAVLAMLLLAPIVSPGVRAIVEDIVRNVGGQLIHETALYPFTDESPLLEPSQVVTLEEARDMVEFDFALPTAVPERYVRLDEVIVTPGFHSVLIRWKGQETRGDGLSLHVSPAKPDVAYVVGPGGLQEIEINGQEAVFITGGWLENTRDWEPNINRDVRWTQDGLAYQLSTGGQFSCPDEPEKRCPLSDEDLIRIAESVD